MSFWIHDGSLHSRWVPAFTMGSWMHDGFVDSRWVPGAVHGTEMFGTAQIITARPGHMWRGTDPWTRRFMAQPGPKNRGTENLGTARHGEYWHRKVLARHGTKHLDVWAKYVLDCCSTHLGIVDQLIWGFVLFWKLVLFRWKAFFRKMCTI